MSAIAAVSVRNCSCTQTNRSLRAKPRRTSPDSGATTIGLVFWMKSAVTGGPSPRSRLSPGRIGPMRDLAGMRGEEATTSSPPINGRASGSIPGVAESAPPPSYFPAPGAVGAGQRRQMHIGLLGGAGAVRIDDDELGAALLPGLRDMGHHIDLGRHRVAAPDDDQVGFGDLAGVDPAPRADPGPPAGIG